MRYVPILLILSLILTACGKKKAQPEVPVEDRKAKTMLSGVWIDADDGGVVFKVKGDSIFYPDSASSAVRFAVYADTLVMYGSTKTKYKIIRQEQHSFEFVTLNGDIVKIEKSNDLYDAKQFEACPQFVLNQRKLIKRDTVVIQGNTKYHCYVQVNPTTYKVLRTSYNDEGIAVDHIYYDNTIHVSVFQGAAKLFSKDFCKSDFSTVVPQNMLSQSILSDIVFDKADSNGIHHIAQLAIPDSPSSCIVSLFISYDGKFDITIK